MPGRFAEPVFVPYHAPLQRGTLVERRDRFIAEVSLDGQQSVLAHCINPGRMEAFVRPGARVWVLPTEKADRKLRYSWEAIEVMGVRGANIIASTNTVRPNVLVRALLEARCLPDISFCELRAERNFVAGSHSGRVDFLLDEQSASPHYVEVKNCHMVYEDGWGYFPDSVSERATRHVDALAALVAGGARASVIIVVQRSDVEHGVRPSAFHDPAFAAAAVKAAQAGVQFRAVRASVDLQGTYLTHELPVDLSGHASATVLTDVGRQWEANRESTGWTRSASGSRVANGPFPHHLAAARQAAKRAKQEAQGAGTDTSRGKKKRSDDGSSRGGGSGGGVGGGAGCRGGGGNASGGDFSSAGGRARSARSAGGSAGTGGGATSPRTVELEAAVGGKLVDAVGPTSEPDAVADRHAAVMAARVRADRMRSQGGAAGGKKSPFFDQ